jgi:hypothetical protein
LENAIFYGAKPPLELLKYKYRLLFKLTAEELEKEPADQFFTNLLIYGYIKEKEKFEIKKAEQNGKS